MAEISSGEISEGEVASHSNNSSKRSPEEGDHGNVVAKKAKLEEQEHPPREKESKPSHASRENTSEYQQRRRPPQSQGASSSRGAPSHHGATSTAQRIPPQTGTTQTIVGYAQPPPHGLPIHVKETRGKFPDVGSTLGPFFCLGQLGKGTFSSVHKCINMEYYNNTQQEKSRRRLAAAKVELRGFIQTGVLESEAMILDFLHQSLPPLTVPVYMGHYRCGQYAAIVMEYLPGEDMNQLRETIVKQTRSRRLHVEDAVYLTADVFLPLLRRMHSVAVVHRDVKPSNAVRMAPDVGSGKSNSTDNNNNNNTPKDPRAKFCLVDFGLSKSIVVPEDSPLADRNHPWPKDRVWCKPANYAGNACFRKEREKADFRGSSMYASLRVHQSKDYCPRDDVWSVLYVFCDLVSGGLPWMSHAANKERHECGRLKEIIQGNGKTDEMHQLLMGDEYHVTKHRHDYKIDMAKRQGLPPPNLPPLPIPLAMSTDKHLVDCLRKAFAHLATLEFWDAPNYDFVAQCIRGFLDDPSKCPNVPKIKWEEISRSTFSNPPLDVESPVPSTSKTTRKLPLWVPESEPFDPACLVNSDLFSGAQEQATKERHEEVDDFAIAEDPRTRLPVNLQYGLEQMNNHVKHINAVPKHIALRDWFQITLPLIYQNFWDVKEYEESHRSTGDDGYRRPLYLKLLRQCYEWAQKFDYFTHPSCYFHDSDNNESKENFCDRRRRTITTVDGKKLEDMVLVSKSLMALKLAIQDEQNRRSAPPMRISFGPN